MELPTLEDLEGVIELMLSISSSDAGKNLIDILDHTNGKSLLAQWVSTKPCQIKPLIDILVKNDDNDGICPVALRKICRNNRVAEEVSIMSRVYISPVLSHLIQHVLTDSLGLHPERIELGPQPVTDLRYPDSKLELCEATLPLASHSPKDLSMLLDDVFGNEEDVPRNIWNRRIKAIISTQALNALATVKETYLEVAYENWKIQMQSKDHFDALTSLHIAASLQRLVLEGEAFPSSGIQSDEAEISTTLSKWIAQAGELFTLPKGPSTIKATFLRTLKAVTEATSNPLILYPEMASMARDILTVVEPESMKEWEKVGEVAANKLMAKLLDSDMSPILLVNACGVLLIGSPLHKHRKPANVISIFESLVKAILGQRQLLATTEINNPDDFVQSLVQLLPGDAEEPTSQSITSHCIEVVVSMTFDLCHPRKGSIETSLGTKWATLLISALAKRVFEEPQGFIATIFCSVVRDLGFPTWWPVNLSDPGNPRNCENRLVCPHHAESRRQRLCLRVSRIFSKLTGNDSQLVTRGNVIEQVVNVQIHQASPEKSWNTCQFGLLQQSDQGNIVLIEEDGAITIRRSLSQDLKVVCKGIQESVMSHVEQRCHDLQDRCDNVERPLQEAKDKSSELKRALDEIQADMAALQETHELLKADFSRAQHDLALLSQRGEDLNTELESLRLDYAKLRQELTSTVKTMGQMKQEYEDRMEKIIHDTRKEICDRDLARHGEALLRQQDSENDQEKRAELEAEVEWLTEQLADIQKDLRDSHDNEIAKLRMDFTRELGAANKQIEIYANLYNQGYCRERDATALAKDAVIEAKETTVQEKEAIIQQKDATIQAKEATIQEMEARIHEIIQEKDAQIQEMVERNKKSWDAVADWQSRALQASRELNEAREAERKLLDVLQRPRSNPKSV